MRPARLTDVEAMADVQVRSWRATFGESFPAEVLAQFTSEAFAPAWRDAVTTPPSAQHRVYVACAGATVVGLLATAPARFENSGAGGAATEVVALLVDPAHQRAGHGSRLLAAAVDSAAADDATHVTAWILDGDPAREAFFRGAGMAPDGTSRHLEIGDRLVPEYRWSARLPEK